MVWLIHVDPEHEPALGSKACVAEPISSRRFGLKVTATVGLERDLERRPSEVQGVIAHPMLLMTGKDVVEAGGRMDTGLRQGLDYAVLSRVAIEPTRREKARWQRTGSHDTESVHGVDRGGHS